MSNNLNMPPMRGLEELQSALFEHLSRVGGAVRAEGFSSMLDPLMRRTLERGFAEAGADEGTVWLLDQAGENLVPAFNNGPDAGKFVGHFKQPLNRGLICMVFASEQPFLENEILKNPRQSKALDHLLHVQTCAMIAVPFPLLRACRGVVSCVRLKKPEAPEPHPAPEFRPEHLSAIQQATTLLSRLLELKLLAQAIGWAGE